MTTAIDYLISSPSIRASEKSSTIAMATTELEALRTIEAAARLFMDHPNGRTRAKLREALDLLPEVIGA